MVESCNARHGLPGRVALEHRWFGRQVGEGRLRRKMLELEVGEQQLVGFYTCSQPLNACPATTFISDWQT